MQKITLLAAGLSLGLSALAQVKPSAELSTVWVADQGDGTYKNPVLHADYSDPDVCRVGADFYLTASSFDAIPGLPILHSKDLVNWSLIGHALRRQPPFDHFSKTQHGNGVCFLFVRRFPQEPDFHPPFEAADNSLPRRPVSIGLRDVGHVHEVECLNANPLHTSPFTPRTRFTSKARGTGTLSGHRA